MILQAYVTTAIYALTKQLGLDAAATEWLRQVNAPTPESLPVARTIGRLRAITSKASPSGGVGLKVDHGGTIIGQMRSRCFHAAYESGFPAWISIDDDVEATTDTCAALLAALDDPEPRIVVVPYLLRTMASSEPKISVTLPRVRTFRTVEGGAHLVTLPHGSGAGFGLVGMNRLAMHKIWLAHSGEPALAWTDADDGLTKIALFHDLLERGIWWGEDTSFFRRVPRGVSVEALLCGHTNHAGNRLALDRL